jgi:hypothetical protein
MARGSNIQYVAIAVGLSASQQGGFVGIHCFAVFLVSIASLIEARQLSLHKTVAIL